MRLRPGLLAAASWGLAACSGAEPLRLDIPVLPETHTVLVGYESGGNPAGVGAVDLDSRAGVEALPQLDLGAAITVSVAYYGGTPAELGLAPGRVDGYDGPAARSLPPFAHARAVTVRDHQLGEWQPIVVLPAQLEAVRLPPLPTECATFTPTSFTVDSASDAEFAVAADAGAALVGTADGKVFRLTGTGTPTAVGLPAGLPTHGAVRDAEGTLWFGGWGGALWRGRWAGGRLEASQVSTSSSGRTLHWMAGGSREGRIELYTLSESGVLERWDGVEWRILFRFPELVSAYTRGGLVQLGPGEVVAGYALLDRLVHVRGTSVSLETPDPTNRDGFAALALVPGAGLVAATASGAFYRQGPAGWEVLPGATIGLSRDVILPFEGGFLYAGGVGFVGQYLPEGRFCEERVLASDSIRFAVALGDDLVLAGVKPSSQANLPLTILHRQR